MAKKRELKTKKSKTIASKKYRSVSLKDLHLWNILLVLLLTAQGLAIAVLGRTVSLPINTSYLNVDSLASHAAGHQVLTQASRHLFDVNLLALVTTIIFLSAIFHLLIVTNYRGRYEATLKQGVNKLRWIDFGLTAGLMLVVISLLNGVYDISILLAIFVLIALLHILGYFLETQASSSLKSKMHIFKGLLLAGGTVWLIIALYVKAAIIYGQGLPHYVYFIDGSIFIITLGLALNTYLSFRRIGRWKNYLYSERNFMVLSLIAKTALTWQIYLGILRV